MIRFITSKNFAKAGNGKGLLPSKTILDTIKKYSWTIAADRSHLWRDGHLDHFIHRQVHCRCGGLLRRDLGWPPARPPARTPGLRMAGGWSGT